MRFFIYYLLVFTLSSHAGRAELSNSLEDLESEAAGREACDRLENHVLNADLGTQSEYPPHLAGKWISQGCEVRSGPEYVIRSYSFSRNNTFKLLQFHYADASCTSPQWAVVARGRLRTRGRSWVIPGATEAEYSLHKVTVLAHRPHAAADLARKVNATCPGIVRRRWRAFREYVVLNLAPDDSPEYTSTSWDQLRSSNVANKAEIKARQYRSHADEEVDCADSVLPASFHELQLIRVQHRPESSPDSRDPRLELLLGDVHSRPEMRLSYRPTAYQPPLLRTDKISDCALCREVSRATERSPPHLPARARLPVFLSGEFLSPRCEVRPLGMFIKRRLRFSQDSRKWAGEFRYFSDPACSLGTMTTHATGRFSTGRDSALVHAGTELEFRVDTAALSIHDEGIINALNAAKVNECGGRELWERDEIQDITSTGGCEVLGITVPMVERELVKLEMDKNGNSLLYLGQVDTERGPGETRPTAYQAPLIQCKSSSDLLILTHHFHRSVPSSVAMSNQLYPIPHARVALNVATQGQPTAGLSVLIMLCVFRL